MKKFICILLGIILFGCNNSNKEVNSNELSLESTKTQLEEPLFFITDCDTIPKDLFEEPEVKYGGGYTFQNKTLVYCSPTIESKVLMDLGFNTNISGNHLIRILLPEEMERQNKKNRYEDWYEVRINNQKGFIQKKDLAIRHLGYMRHNLIIGRKDNDTVVKVISYDEKNRHKPVDSLQFNYMLGMYDDEIGTLVFNGLDFSESIIINRNYRRSCPGGALFTFISVSQKGHLTHIINSGYDSISGSTIYFPMKFENGKVLLVADADLENIFNAGTGELNIYEYPKDLNIPITQLIIETKTEYEEDLEIYQLNEEEPKIKSSVINFYKWNGSKLIKVKSIKEK